MTGTTETTNLTEIESIKKVREEFSQSFELGLALIRDSVRGVSFQNDDSNGYHGFNDLLNGCILRLKNEYINDYQATEYLNKIEEQLSAFQKMLKEATVGQKYKVFEHFLSHMVDSGEIQGYSSSTQLSGRIAQIVGKIK